MITNPHMLPKVRSDDMEKSCRGGMPCSLRIANMIGKTCDGISVEGHHVPVFGKGMGTKVSDLFMAASCRTCHDIAHSRIGAELRIRYPNAYTERLWFGMCETR